MPYPFLLKNLALPPEITEPCNYIAKEGNVCPEWALAGFLGAVFIAVQGKITVQYTPHFSVPTTASIILLGNAGTGKDRSKNIALQPIWAIKNLHIDTLICKSITPARLIDKLHENGGFISVVDGELDSLIKLFSSQDHRNIVLNMLEGECVENNTMRKSVKIERALGTFITGAQPDRFRKYIERYELCENGFLSRSFIISKNAYNAPREALRCANPWKDNSKTVYSIYSNKLQTLTTQLVVNDTGFCFTLASGAQRIFERFQNEITQTALPRLKQFEVWLRRAPGHCLKIAGILYAYDKSFKCTEIDEPTMHHAVEITWWLLTETVLSYEILLPEKGLYEAVIIALYLRAYYNIFKFIHERELYEELRLKIPKYARFKDGISMLLQKKNSL